eukprot:364424-Chlamydomonas_euryale.AAC.1
MEHVTRQEPSSRVTAHHLHCTGSPTLHVRPPMCSPPHPHPCGRTRAPFPPSLHLVAAQRKLCIYDRNGRIYDEVSLPQPEIPTQDPSAPSCAALVVRGSGAHTSTSRPGLHGLLRMRECAILEAVPDTLGLSTLRGAVRSLLSARSPDADIPRGISGCLAPILCVAWPSASLAHPRLPMRL